VVGCKVKDSLKYFIGYMNRLASEMGLFNTNFANPHGLMNKYNKSSAEDIAKLASISMENESFKKIVSTKL